MADAMPALKRAEQAVKMIKSKQIDELKKMK